MMLINRAWCYLAQYLPSSQYTLDSEPLEEVVFPHFSFSEQWQVIGPFQIGTREIAWGADPLELYGGFRNLEFDHKATFRSSLAANGTVAWSNHTGQASSPSIFHAESTLAVTFPNIDWQFLQDVYGWAALQWQGWARGQMNVAADEAQTVVFHVNQILELWIDDENFFGGDFYGNRRAPLSIQLEPGFHRIDIRLYRDVRAFGGIGDATLEVRMELTRLYPLGQPLIADDVLVSDVIDGKGGVLASPYASVSVRNDGQEDVYIKSIEGTRDVCEFELLSDEPLKLSPGQTRPVGFRFDCVPPFGRRFDFQFQYSSYEADQHRPLYFGVAPRVLDRIHVPQRITYIHPGGMVSYAILRPPPNLEACMKKEHLPIIIALHGAGVEADSDQVKHALDPLTDLCAWVLFPSGVTPWSGDDWHTWGFADVEAAVDAIKDWTERMDWRGPLPNTLRWIVVGHSNGGQGTWYAVTHRTNHVVAAAPLSGYSSIQTYVPYSFWRTAEPGLESMVHAAMLDYRHELLLENVQDIPIFEQHGSADDNVPAYHSRLLNQRIHQVGAESNYVEIPGRPHWWDGVMSTDPLRAFLYEQVRLNEGDGPKSWSSSHRLADFSLVVANPGDMEWKHLARIDQLGVPGRLGRLEFTFDEVTATCNCTALNVVVFSMKPPFAQECRTFFVDAQAVDISALATSDTDAIVAKSEQWSVQSTTANSIPFFRQDRRPSQQGGLEAILRTKGAFRIMPHSPSTQRIALQISRNLHQYFAADTTILSSYEDALIGGPGHLISVAIGADLPKSSHPSSAFTATASELFLRDGDLVHRYAASDDYGLAAIFVRPPHRFSDRLELVVWGIDEDSLGVAARLVPLLTGTGQPDFVVLDRRVMWKGLEGVRAMGYFDGGWEVSQNSFV